MKEIGFNYVAALKVLHAVASAKVHVVPVTSFTIELTSLYLK